MTCLITRWTRRRRRNIHTFRDISIIRGTWSISRYILRKMLKYCGNIIFIDMNIVITRIYFHLFLGSSMSYVRSYTLKNVIAMILHLTFEFHSNSTLIHLSRQRIVDFISGDWYIYYRTTNFWLLTFHHSKHFLKCVTPRYNILF